MGLRMPECNDDFFKYGRIVAIVATVVFLVSTNIDQPSCINTTFAVFSYKSLVWQEMIVKEIVRPIKL